MSDKYNPIAESLSDYDRQATQKLIAILQSWLKTSLPDGFADRNVHPFYNKDTGLVALENDDYQLCVLGKHNVLQLYHETPENGFSGTLAKIMDEETPTSIGWKDSQYIRHALEYERLIETGEYPLWVWHELPDSLEEGFLDDLMRDNNPDDLSLEDKVYIMTQGGFDDLLKTGKFPSWNDTTKVQ